MTRDPNSPAGAPEVWFSDAPDDRRSTGALLVDNVTTTQVRGLGPRGSTAAPFPYAFMDRFAEAYAAEMDHFARVIEGETPSTGYAASVRSLALAEAAATSARHNIPVTL